MVGAGSAGQVNGQVFTDNTGGLYVEGSRRDDKTIPNGQVGVSTVGEVRAAGGNVIPKPTAKNHFIVKCVG